MEKKTKTLFICFFILFALPIPVAFLGSLLTLMWFIIGFTRETVLLERISALSGLLIGATYIYSYIYALRSTKREKKISKKTFLPFAHCLAAAVYVLLMYPTSVYISKTTERFGFRKADFTVLEECDTHGGFLGDGTYYLIMDCSDNKEKALKLIKGWNKLPLSRNLELTMFGGEKDGRKYSFGFAEEAKMPKIENGFYMFEDRHSESENSKDDSDLLSRASFNFSIAVYDCDTDIFYFFALDT